MKGSNMKQIEAPWTNEQVDSLREYQDCGLVHPFTCNNENCRDELRPTNQGWVCDNCSSGTVIQQTWAHDFMLSFEPPHIYVEPWIADEEEKENKNEPNRETDSVNGNAEDSD